MDLPACVNVPAEACTVIKAPGHWVVRCLGQDYYVIGWYFGRGRRWRELHYILARDIRFSASNERTKSA